MAKDVHQVLMVHAYHQEYPWTRNQHRGFVETYSAGTHGHADYRVEYLDTKRRAYDADYAQKFANYLSEKYVGYLPDVIYVSDDNGLLFARDHLTRVFPGTPIFFSGVNDYGVLPGLANMPIRGVFERKDIFNNLRFLQTVDGLDRILVLGDGSNTAWAITEGIKVELAQNFNGIKAEYISGSHIDQVVSELSQKNQRYIYLSSIGGIRDESGNLLTVERIISSIASAGSFAVVVMEDSYIQSGALGGVVTSGHHQGEDAARLALREQTGESMLSLQHVTDSPNVWMFDHRELERLDIELPDSILNEAIILNLPSTFLEKNQQLILALIIALVVMVLVLMLGSILSQQKSHRKIKQALTQTSQQAHALERLNMGLKAAQEVSIIGVWEWNIDSGSMCWSKQFNQILGKPQTLEASLDVYLDCVVEGDRDEVSAQLKQAIEVGGDVRLEHCVQREDGDMRHVRLIGKTIITEQQRFLTLILLDTTAQYESDQQETMRVERIERYRQALLDWAEVDYQNLGEAFQRVTEISANTLNVNRVGIWLCDDACAQMHCEDLFDAVQGHSHGLVLKQADSPIYFDALNLGRPIVAHTANQDQKTSELTAHYLEPNGIKSLLVLPIAHHGRVVGAIGCEQTQHERTWTIDEQEFASAIAKSVSLSLEVDKRRQIELQLQHQAYHDDLTGLPNRSLLLDRLERGITRSQREDELLAVLFLDLDNFKQINDSFGHAFGDSLLIKVAERLKTLLRDVDTICRLGGDEFTILAGGFSSISQVNGVAVKLFSALQTPFEVDQRETYVTSSIGISIFPHDGTKADILLRNADAAMYRAKEEGRNGFQYYTQDMTDEAMAKVMMITNLRRAIEQESFEVHFQPQWDLTENRVVGVEALVRWEDSELGRVPPDKFIPVAEESGQIIPLDRWVMRHSLGCFKQWRDQGHDFGRLSLNMSVKQLEQADLVPFIERILDETGCNSEWLSFEVTESLLMKDPDRAIEVLNQISALGIEISIDDFGTGYSSLAYLKKLPVDKLKIDRSFIRDTPDDEEDVAIVRAVAALAQSLRLQVVAEGVETEEQLAFLEREGCTQIQGYYFSPPVAADKLPEVCLRIGAEAVT